MQMSCAAAVPAEKGGTQGACARVKVEAMRRVALAGPDVADRCIYHYLCYVCYETRFHARAPLSAANHPSYTPLH
jgi:hypothetical protein